MECGCWESPAAKFKLRFFLIRCRAPHGAGEPEAAAGGTAPGPPLPQRPGRGARGGGRAGLRGAEARREPPPAPLRRRCSRAMRHAGSRAAAGILARSFPGAAAAASVCGAEAGTQKSGCGCPPAAGAGGERPRRWQHGKERGRGTERGVAAAAAALRGAGMPGETGGGAAPPPPPPARCGAPQPPASAERGHGGAAPHGSAPPREHDGPPGERAG